MTTQADVGICHKEDFQIEVTGPLLLRHSLANFSTLRLGTGLLICLWLTSANVFAQQADEQASIQSPEAGEVTAETNISREESPGEFSAVQHVAQAPEVPVDVDIRVESPDSPVSQEEDGSIDSNGSDEPATGSVEESALEETDPGSEVESRDVSPQQHDSFAADQQEAIESSTQDLNILGTSIGPGESHRLLWVASETSYGSKLETPVYVIRGTNPGPTLCLTSAIHGDELNGVEIVRQLLSGLSPGDLYGTVIGVPIVNLLGFTRGSRYLPDRRDLNRYFPGNPYGSSASRIAYSFFGDIVSHCDLLIDLHTGSLNRTNMAQVRANLQIPEVLEFTTKFGSTAVLHSRKLQGNLRSAATNRGIPAVALELGEPGSLQEEHIEEGVEIIETVMSGLDMTRKLWTIGESQPIFYSSRWVRVNYGGLLISKVKVGERIREGHVLGTIINPLTNESFEIVSPHSGRVLGMALNQFMFPGYAAFNIGIVADEETAAVDAQTFECTNTAMDPEQVNEEFGCASGEDEEIERFDLEAAEAEEEESP